MFVQVTQDEWIKALRWGDVGLVKGKTFFGMLQGLLASKEGADSKASHGFIMKNSPMISEADGTRVHGDNKVVRYFTGHHKIWIFRRKAEITPIDRRVGEAFIYGIEQASYGGLGIVELAKKYWALLRRTTYKVKDKVGVFCTELCSMFAVVMLWPWVPTMEPQEVDPSTLLDWMIDHAVPSGQFEMVAFFDRGTFFLADQYRK